MNVADFRDIRLQVRVEVDEIMSEVIAEWLRPDIEMQVATAANAMALMRPEAVEFIDSDTDAGILEVLNHARKS